LPIHRHELVLPDLGMAEIPVLASVWLVEAGAEVTEGDRLLEVVAGSVTVDLPSPASGTLSEIFVGEDDPLAVGQLLAVVTGDSDAELA
jgi:pyruvate/2-oxoglutarate dehydrogenase complex dihydrolipoamide acyltransferase (E2) component